MYKPTKVGTNLQTVPDDWPMENPDHPLAQGMRDLFMADDGYDMFQCDLKGSDGYTIGANLKALGDSTMLDDLNSGIKPAQVIAYMLANGVSSITGKSRAELRVLCETVDKKGWHYFVSKIGIWGCAYLMGSRRLAENIFIQSAGKINLSFKQAEDFKAAVFARYKLPLWHRSMQRKIDEQRYPFTLTGPNGFTRRFFGRRTEILGEALAHMPQVITTWATNLAIHKCWFDPANRIPKETGCALRVEPLHQVHDAFVGQFKHEDREWAIAAIARWFNNPIQIAGTTLIIPYTLSIGPTWGDLVEV